MERDLNGELFTEERKKENCIFIAQFLTDAAT